MLSLSTLKLLKLPVVLIILGVLTFGFVCSGMASHASMHSTDMDSPEVVVLGANQQECCNTSISKNIDTWKNITLVVPDKVRDSLMLLALGLALALGGSWLSFRDRHFLPDPDIGRLRLYVQQNPNIPLFNHLKLAFARGILNPKLY